MLNYTVYMDWSAEVLETSYYMLNGATPWNDNYKAVWVEKAPALAVTAQ